MHARALIRRSQPREPKDGRDPPVKKEAKPRPPPTLHPRAPHDPLAIRTVIVSGLPPAVDAHSLWKKMRKYKGAEKCDWPAKADNAEDATTGERARPN